MDEGGATTAISTLARCAACGYWLNGLPAIGNCQECGQPYDDKHLVLLGWARGSHGSIHTSRGVVLAGYLALFLLQFGPLGVFRAIRSLYTWDAGGLFLCAAYGMIVGAELLGRWDRAIPETTRVVLDDSGFRQESVPHQSPMGMLFVLAIGCYAMAGIAADGKPLQTRDVMIGLVVLGVVALVAIVIKRFGARARAARPIPWSKAAEARLSGEGHGRYQIRIDKRGRWLFEDVVNMDLDLTIPQRDELEQRLSAWAPKKPAKQGLG